MNFLLSHLSYLRSINHYSLPSYHTTLPYNMFSKGTLVIMLVVIIPSLISNCYMYWKNRKEGQTQRKYFWGIVINIVLGILILLANYYNL